MEERIPVRLEWIWADKAFHDALACGAPKLVEFGQAGLSSFCRVDHRVVVRCIHFPGLSRLQWDSKKRTLGRMCNLSKGLFGKMGNAHQPLFVCVEGFSLSTGREVSPMLTMGAEPEMMLQRPTER